MAARRVIIGHSAGGLLAIVSFASVALGAPVHHRHHHGYAVEAEARPLTIAPRRGLYRRGNDIIAPGGFSAQGYGYPVATPDERREALNERIRREATGLYGAGVDGVGGWGFDDDPEAGYDNPYYGNTFNRYVGYNGVPTNLAFGPAFANRRLTEHDPTDDPVPPGPDPADLGYEAHPGD